MMAPSAVWCYLKKTDNNKKVKCGKELLYNKSTTTLANHLKAAHQILLPKQMPTSIKNAKRIKVSHPQNDSIDNSAFDGKLQVGRAKKLRQKLNIVNDISI